MPQACNAQAQDLATSHNVAFVGQPKAAKASIQKMRHRLEVIVAK